MDKAWKRDERKVAKFFGTNRNPLSGSQSRHTASDTLHSQLYIEVKRRKAHSIAAWWRKAKIEADKEDKIPVVAISEYGRKGFWVLVHVDDLAEFIGEIQRDEYDETKV
jgi:hypothetical protein